MTEYYDLVLGAIPISLISISAVLSLLGVSLATAVPLAAFVSVGLIGHAMFVNGPVDAPRPSSEGVTDGDAAETTVTSHPVAGD